MRRKHTVANVLSSSKREREKKIARECKHKEEEEYNKQCCKKKRKTAMCVL